MTDDTNPGPGDQPLVGASEAALLLGVQLSTFSHLRRRELTEEGSKFPKPVATLRCGPIWKTSEIKRFATKYEKPRPGPKPGAALPVKRTRAKKVAPEVVAGNGQADGETKPVKKAAAKKAVAKRPAKKVAAPV